MYFLFSLAMVLQLLEQSATYLVHLVQVFGRTRPWRWDFEPEQNHHGINYLSCTIPCIFIYQSRLASFGHVTAFTPNVCKDILHILPILGKVMKYEMMGF